MANGDAANKNSLKAKDAIILIESLQKAGVTHFSGLGLEISFLPPKPEEPILAPQPKPDIGGIPLRIDQEDHLQELMLIDPAGYEDRVHEILAQGEQV